MQVMNWKCWIKYLFFLNMFFISFLALGVERLFSAGNEIEEEASTSLAVRKTRKVFLSLTEEQIKREYFMRLAVFLANHRQFFPSDICVDLGSTQRFKRDDKGVYESAENFF